MTAPRIIVAGATTAITRRTTLRKAFLAPWDPLVQQCWLYALADAQRHTRVDVHFGICVVTHHQLCVTPNEDNLPLFARRVHRDVSASINTLLTRHRYDAPGELFDGRIPHYQRLCDAPAQAARLVYDANNCVAAGLVDRRQHMPGQVFDFDMWRQGYIDVPRPDVYFDERRPEVIRMRVTPPPLLHEAFGGDVARLAYHMERLADEAGRKTRQARKRPALGARAVRRLHPWSEPRTLRERGGQRIPTFSIGARGVFGWQRHVEAATETRDFRRRYRDARIARRAGDRGARFPFGTYEMRVEHNAPVETDARATAIVARPGPTFEEVESQLADERAAGKAVATPATVAVLDEVRGALAAHVDEVCEREQFEPAQQVTSDPPARTPVRTRHRFARAAPEEQAGNAACARIVVHRDRRRGRPPGAPPTA